MVSPYDFDTAAQASRAMLVRMARRIVGDSDAEDVVQDALLSCWRAREAWQHQAALSTWLGRAVLNRALRVLAQRQQRITGDTEFAAAQWPLSRARADARVYLQEFWTTLTAEEKTMFTTFFDGDPRSSPGYKTRYRARQRAVQRFQQREDDHAAPDRVR